MTIWTFRAGVKSCSLLALLILGSQAGRAESKQAARIDPLGIRGTLVICGGGKLPSEVEKKFVELAGENNARLVVIPTASSNADVKPNTFWTDRWKKAGIKTIEVLHTRDRAVANQDTFVAPLRKATAVWVPGGQQSRLAAAYQGTKVERALKELLERGGVVGGTSAGAAIQSRVMIASGTTTPQIKTGWDLLPGTIIDQHFTERNRQARLRKAVADHPECVGLGIDESTALIVGSARGRMSQSDRGRTMRVMGAGHVTVRLAASATKPAKEIRVARGGLLDLVQLQRAAQERQNNFPSSKVGDPVVPKGALVIIGGGIVPRSVVRRILDLSGGANAKIVALSAAYTPERAPERGFPGFLVQGGARNISVLHARSPEELTNSQIREAIRTADCVWFGGGRQWRFCDAFENSGVIELFHEVLNRGGVIAGSSAGASIQGEYLARADALTNRKILAEGYERGFNFLPGTAIDQHFSERDRAPDMRHLISTYPQFLGIGIDEATALVVQKQHAQVIGWGKVHFFEANDSADSPTVETTSVPALEAFNLKTREIFPPAIAESTR